MCVMLESVNSWLFQGVSVDGVTVSIVAFQAAVPGSTPGRRKFFCLVGKKKSESKFFFIEYYSKVSCNWFDSNKNVILKNGY